MSEQLVFDSFWLLIEISQWSEEAYRSIRKVNRTGWKLATSKEREVARARMILECGFHKIHWLSDKGYVVFTDSITRPYNKHGVSVYAEGEQGTYIQSGDQVYAKIGEMYKKCVSRNLRIASVNNGNGVLISIPKSKEEYFRKWAVATSDDQIEFERLLIAYKNKPFVD